MSRAYSVNELLCKLWSIGANEEANQVKELYKMFIEQEKLLTSDYPDIDIYDDRKAIYFDEQRHSVIETNDYMNEVVFEIYDA